MLRSLVYTLLVLGGAPARGEVIPRTALGPRTVRFTYEAHVTPPADARVLELWLPVPHEDDQEVLELTLQGPTPTVVRFPSGDRAAYVRVADPRHPITLTETATMVRRELRAPVERSRAGIADVDP